MRLSLKAVSVVALLALACGCQSVHVDQFQIAPNPATAGSDEAAVQQIVSGEALRLESNVQPPTPPRCADSFIEIRNYDPLHLGQVALVGRHAGDGIIVDVTIYTPHDYANVTRLYDDLRRSVGVKLRAEFGDRVQEVKGPKAVPLMRRPPEPLSQGPG